MSNLNELKNYVDQLILMDNINRKRSHKLHKVILGDNNKTADI